MHHNEFLDLSYYCDTQAVPLPFSLPGRVFDVKAAMAAWLATARRSLEGVVHPRAEIDGAVIVEPGATVDAGAVIIGPALICRGAYVGRGLVRDHTVIGPGSKVGYSCEIARSLILAESRAMHFVFIGDSIIGSQVNVGSSSVLANLRVDRPVVEPAVDELSVTVADAKVGTGQTKFGAVLGDRVQLPALTSVAPGTLIGPDVTIYPTDQLGGLYPSQARVKS
ncbi:LbetaH domain-containing protein [Nocardiopsis coralliicola]